MAVAFFGIGATHFKCRTCDAYNLWMTGWFLSMYTWILFASVSSIYLSRQIRQRFALRHSLYGMHILQPLQTAQLIAQSKHTLFLSPSVMLVLGTYWIIPSLHYHCSKPGRHRWLGYPLAGCCKKQSSALSGLWNPLIMIVFHALAHVSKTFIVTLK